MMVMEMHGNRFLIKSICGVILTLCLFSSAFGGDKPTKKETMAFIQEKCDKLKITDKITSRVYLDENDSCTLIIEVNSVNTQIRRHIIPLKEMDPSVVKNGFDPFLVVFTDFSNLGVQLNSKEDKQEKRKAIKTIIVSYDENKKEERLERNDENAIFLCNSELSAEKVAKAITHLIELCGGKSDLF
ncbi:MAG: hypothetical protein HQL06_09315 [Nitrospirae bacterium]|nr:hypothetical protein [Nitrospirota bacterium]